MTKRKYDLIIFDWDGTIINSEAHIVQSMQMAIADEKLSSITPREISHIIGLSLPIAIRTLFPDISEEVIQRLGDRYREHFFSESTAASELFDGVKDVILDLHANGYYLAVATGKGRRGLDQALQHSGLEPYFHITRCAEETRSKPDPLMLGEILTDLDLKVSSAIMIGDTSYDIQMANNLNMDSVAVTYGVHEKSHLIDSHPTYFIDSIKQLSQYI